MGSGISTKSAVAILPRRQSEVFKPQSVSSSNPGKPPELSRLDCDMLRRSWRIMFADGSDQLEAMHEFGIELYDQIFLTSPELMRFFPAIQQATSGPNKSIVVDLRQLAAFRNQALRLVDVLAYCVRGCEPTADGGSNNSSLNERLRELGVRHRMYSTISSTEGDQVPQQKPTTRVGWMARGSNKTSLALTREHFRVTERATLVVIQSRLEEQREKAKLGEDDAMRKMMQAWTNLLAYMVHQIYAGYTIEEK